MTAAAVAAAAAAAAAAASNAMATMKEAAVPRDCVFTAICELLIAHSSASRHLHPHTTSFQMSKGERSVLELEQGERWRRRDRDAALFLWHV